MSDNCDEAQARKRWVKYVPEELPGQKFGRWHVQGIETVERKIVVRETHCLCVCECGNTALIPAPNLVHGSSTQCKSCANSQRRRTHGGTGTRLHRIWKGLVVRGTASKNRKLNDYYLKGIRLCEEWQQFSVFRDWAQANGYRDDLSLDRWPDQNGNYEPSNCRWATLKQQARNKTNNRSVTAFGETKIIAEWAEDPRCTVTPGRISHRLRRGMPPEEAITRPVTAASLAKARQRWKHKHEEKDAGTPMFAEMATE